MVVDFLTFIQFFCSFVRMVKLHLMEETKLYIYNKKSIQ